MKHLCIWLIRFYQKCVSPLKRYPTCRFSPTCSAYAIEAYTKRGFFAGTILTVWRILRCNPFCPGGYDPVPAKGFKHHQYPKDDDAQAEQDSQAQDSQDNAPGDAKGFLKYYEGRNNKSKITPTIHSLLERKNSKLWTQFYVG